MALGPTSFASCERRFEDSTVRDRLASLSTHGHHLVLSHLFFFSVLLFSHASGARMTEEADRLLCATFTYHLS